MNFTNSENLQLAATIAVGAEITNAIAVTIQLKDKKNGSDITARASVLAYFSNDANGDSVATTAPTSVAIGTDGLAIPLVAGKCFLLTSEADGDIDLAIGEAGAATWYLVLVMPHGELVVSGAITFTT